MFLCNILFFLAQSTLKAFIMNSPITTFCSPPVDQKSTIRCTKFFLCYYKVSSKCVLQSLQFMYIIMHMFQKDLISSNYCSQLAIKFMLPDILGLLKSQSILINCLNFIKIFINYINHQNVLQKPKNIWLWNETRQSELKSSSVH